MFFEYRAFTLAKDPQRPDENQDAFQVDPQRGVAAIADGVSSSLFAGPWAELLTKAVVAEPPNADNSLTAWLTEPRGQWAGSVDLNNLAWHQKPKAQSGAFSTLLWVELYQTDPSDRQAQGGLRMYAYAVGDTCMFHVRGAQTQRCFPLEQSSQFDIDPAVLGSIDKNQDANVSFDKLQDICLPGDLLVLCTDALAAWGLQLLENGSSPDWEALWKCAPGAWPSWIETLRNQNELRYDDSTLVLLRIGGGESPASPIDIDTTIGEDEEDDSDWAEDMGQRVTDVAHKLQSSWNSLFKGGKKK